MTYEYRIFEVSINKKFAREQGVSWQDRKKNIFEIFNEISEKKLFRYANRDDPKYNIAPNFTNSLQSTSCLPLDTDNNVIKIKPLIQRESTIGGQDMAEENATTDSFMVNFELGLIKHEDLKIFEDGSETEIWNYLRHSENAGLLYKTKFGLFVSDEMERIFLVKESGHNKSGLAALLHHLNAKSHAFRTLILSDNMFKITSIPKDKDFNPSDIASIKSLVVGVNNDLIEEYRRVSGRTSAFSSLLLGAARLFRSGRKVEFAINVGEEGDSDAIALFNDLLGSFSDIEGEDLEKIFSKFKILYKSMNLNKDVEVNFKRELVYKYEVETLGSNFSDFLDAFIWIKGELNGSN